MEFAMGAMSSLLPKLGDLLMEEYKLHKGLRQGIKDLMDELLVIQAALLKVSDVPLDRLDPLVKIWANDVRDLSYAIEDNLDSFMVRVEGLEPTKAQTFLGFIKKTCSKATKLKIRREIANGIKDVKIQVRKVKERYDRYKDVIGNTDARTVVDPRLLAMYKEVSDIVGIDEAMDELMKMLSETDDHPEKNLKTVSVAGFGGLGKTTLAKAVYDKISKKFDCGGFVPVGQNPDMKKVLKDILFELDMQMYSAASTMDERQLINQLRKFLGDKRGGGRLEHLEKLVQLRYLGLLNTPVAELPSEIGRDLKFLQTLVVEGTGIKELPASVGELSKLMCLRASKGTRMVGGIGKLTALEELQLYSADKCPIFFTELEKLTEVRVLVIRFDELDESAYKVLKESLGNLHKVQILKIEFDAAEWRQFGEWEDWAPPSQLHQFMLSRIVLPRRPSWMDSSRIPHLFRLHLVVEM